MPQKTLNLSVARLWLAPVETDLGGYITGFVFLHDQTRGYFTKPFLLPPDCDVSRPVDVSFLACSDFPSEVPNTFQRFQLLATRGQPEQDPTSLNTLWSWPTPNPWNTPELARIHADNGIGYTFPPNHFTPEDYVGLWLLRLGGNPLDTSPQSTRVAASVQFTYSKRCQFPCL